MGSGIVAGFRTSYDEGEEALPVKRRKYKQALLLSTEVYENTPYPAFDDEWQEPEPFERWEHPAMKEQGVIGKQLRIDQVGERYGFPQRLRSPSATAIIAEGADPLGGVIITPEKRHGFPAAFMEPSTWGGGILVHPIDKTWKALKSTGGDRTVNDPVIASRQAIRKRYYKYSTGRE